MNIAFILCLHFNERFFGAITNNTNKWTHVKRKQLKRMERNITSKPSWHDSFPHQAPMHSVVFLSFSNFREDSHVHIFHLDTAKTNNDKSPRNHDSEEWLVPFRRWVQDWTKISCHWSPATSTFSLTQGWTLGDGWTCGNLIQSGAWGPQTCCSSSRLRSLDVSHLKGSAVCFHWECSWWTAPISNQNKKTATAFGRRFANRSFGDSYISWFAYKPAKYLQCARPFQTHRYDSCEVSHVTAQSRWGFHKLCSNLDVRLEVAWIQGVWDDAHELHE